MARPDPRAEPSSLPPERAPRERPPERVVVSSLVAPTSASEPAELDSGVVAVSGDAPPSSRSVTSDDPRVADVEQLIVLNDWRAIASKLGGMDQAGNLPPNLGLVAAVAHSELAKDADQAARDLAFRCAAGVLGMPADSEIVRVLVRRLLRKNPVTFRERPAPPARVSALIVTIVLALGASIGWFLSSGTFTRLVGRL